MKRIIFFTATAVVLLSSCKKDDNPLYDPSVKGPLSVEFDNVAGSSDLALNTGVYTNASGENFTVTKLKYYVSNFRFVRTDGTEYVVPKDECYFLVDESDPDTHEPELSVPEGEYTTLTFTVGVDSLKSTADVSQRTGVLDPAGAALGMYWDQPSGYIFYNVEGTSSAIAGNIFGYHIGGYSASNINNIKTITLDLTARGTPKVKAGKETNIHLFVDVLKAFSGSTNISIAAKPVIGFEQYSHNVADNYAAMFRHDHTEN